MLKELFPGSTDLQWPYLNTPNIETFFSFAAVNKYWQINMDH